MKLEQPALNLKIERRSPKNLLFHLLAFLATLWLLLSTISAIEGTVDYIGSVRCQSLIEIAGSSGVISVATKNLSLGLSCIENKFDGLPSYLSLKSNFHYLTNKVDREAVPLSIQLSIQNNASEIKQFSQAKLRLSFLPLGTCIMACFILYCRCIIQQIL